MMMVGGIPMLTPSYYPGHRKMQVGTDEGFDYEYGNEGIQSSTYKGSGRTPVNKPKQEKKEITVNPPVQKQTVSSTSSQTPTPLAQENLDLASSLNQNLQDYKKVEETLKNKYIDTGKETH